MQVTLDQGRDGGAVMLDRLYHFAPNEMPKDGELAIVVTQTGQLLARGVEDADPKKRTAWMPEDGPGRERYESRAQVSVVGRVTGSVAYSETEGFPIKAMTVRDLTNAACAGPGLRERIRVAVLLAAEDGRLWTEIPGMAVKRDEFEKLHAELAEAGFGLFRDGSKFRITWSEDGL